jgi:hypothetical protein
MLCEKAWHCHKNVHDNVRTKSHRERER